MDGQRKSTHAPGRPGRGQTRCKSGGEDAAAHAGAGQAMRSLIRVGRYGVQPQRRLPAIVTTSPQLYCTTPARGRGVLPVLAYYTTSSGREGGAGQVRPGILGTSNSQPLCLLSFRSRPHHPSCFVRLWCASVQPLTHHGSPASAFLLCHRTPRLFMEPLIHEAWAHADADRATSH